jgi:hypothetical protein
MLDITTDGETWVLSPEELKSVFRSAEHGSVIVYAVGDLGYTRELAVGKRWDDVEKTANYAYRLWRIGDAELTQKKLGKNKFEYRAMKR